MTSPSPRPEASPPRGQRRRERNRARLLSAARRVMSERGVEATTIAQISEAADLGFGTFYNHFESKEAIVEAIVVDGMNRLGDAIDARIAAFDDPARRFATALRSVLASLDRDPVQGWFVVRVDRARLALSEALSHRGRRDLRAGVASGRFHAARPGDVSSVLTAVGGMLIVFLQARLDGRAAQHSPERLADLALRMLGLPPDEATRVAHLPMPEIAPEEE